mgnify:CR=1 FL=1
MGIKLVVAQGMALKLHTVILPGHGGKNSNHGEKMMKTTVNEQLSSASFSSLRIFILSLIKLYFKIRS